MDNPDDLKNNGENLSEETPEQAEVSRRLREMAQNIKGDGVEKPEIEYSNDLSFRSADGNFNILRESDRRVTQKDIDAGVLSSQDKMNISFSRLFEGLPLQLCDPKREMSSERRIAVQSLKEGKPIFLALDESKIDDEFVKASKHFSESHIGVILFPESGSVMNQFSAIEYSDGRIARMMRGDNRENLDDFIQHVNFLTPKVEAKEINDKETAYAMEFIKDGERPKNLTHQEVEDWLARARESGLIFGFDVGEDDSSLDNFIRKDNRIFWVDGNILQSRPAKSEQELDDFIESQKRTLDRYVGRRTETSQQEQQIEKEISPEFVKEVEDSVFPLDDKINILLVKAGLKPASLISIDVKVWNDEEIEQSVPKELAEESSRMIEKSGMAFIRREKPEFTYEYKKPDGTLAPYNQEFISFLIGRDQKSVEFLARALESGDDELKGKAYGFSQTAIDAWLGKRVVLDKTQVAPEISENPAYLFTPGKLSADNWQEEIKEGQRRADFIKKVSPKLYKEFVGEK